MNVADTTLVDIYFGAVAESVRNAVTRPLPTLPPCLTCTYVWPRDLRHC